jgi:hypothetical protein
MENITTEARRTWRITEDSPCTSVFSVSPWYKRNLMKQVSCFLMLIVFASCDKDHLFDCFKSSGPMESETRQVTQDFNRIDVYNNPEVILTQDSVNSITVEAGGHIISGITTEIENGILTIRNENKCNWMRSYSKTIAVNVHVKNLNLIHHHGSSTISSTNQLQSGTFDFNVWNSGDIELSVHADSIYSRQHLAVGDITLSGESTYLYVFNKSNAFTYEKNLSAQNSYIVMKGTGDCHVNVSQSMIVEIYDSGNIYFSGSPQISSTVTGSGKLIHE